LQRLFDNGPALAAKTIGTTAGTELSATIARTNTTAVV
jgi:hypothetical protein